MAEWQPGPGAPDHGERIDGEMWSPSVRPRTFHRWVYPSETAGTGFMRANANARGLDSWWDELTVEEWELWYVFALAYPDLCICPQRLAAPAVAVPPPPAYTTAYRVLYVDPVDVLYVVTPWGVLDMAHRNLEGPWGVGDWTEIGWGLARVHIEVFGYGVFSDWSDWQHSEPDGLAFYAYPGDYTPVFLDGVLLAQGASRFFYKPPDEPPLRVTRV